MKTRPRDVANVFLLIEGDVFQPLQHQANGVVKECAEASRTTGVSLPAPAAESRGRAYTASAIVILALSGQFLSMIELKAGKLPGQDAILGSPRPPHHNFLLEF